MKQTLVFLLIILLNTYGFGQLKPINGVKQNMPVTYLLKNATIVVSPTKIIKDGYLLVENGLIKDVGSILLKPVDAIEIDCKGKVIVPAFIDLNTELGLEKLPTADRRDLTPQIEGKRESSFSWNDAIRADYQSSLNYKANPEQHEKYLKSGFIFSLTHLHDGIARGTGTFVGLGTSMKNLLLFPDVSGHLSLEKGSSKQTYPSSQMGAIALLRQTLYDAQFYSKSKDNTQVNLSLEALNKQLNRTLFFSTNEVLEVFRGQKIAEEFDLKFNFIGSGNEYQHLDDLKKIGAAIVIPAWFPVAYDVSDPYINREIPLKELKHWELAPSNPYLLSSKGIPFAFTLDKNKSEKEFWGNIKKAMERGLSFEKALEALTLQPAKMLGLEKHVGTLEVGKIASFSIYSSNPFLDEAELLESWSYGMPKIYKELDVDGVAGSYRVLVEDKTYNIDISKKGGKYDAKLTNPTKKDFEKVNVQVHVNDITLGIRDSIAGISGMVLLHGKINAKVGVFEGEGTNLNGNWVKWNAIKHKKIDEGTKTKVTKIDSTYAQKIWYPNMAYGYDTLPKQKSYVISNVTVWTNESEGILKDASVVIENGKIAYVGTGTFKHPQGAIQIDGKGMHLTSGIIDEHSHIAISKGVNEGGQSVTSEVSIQDVVRNNDINIYRQLAGGVTTSQLLHGSANAIGGQSAIIKLKWGYSPEEMLLAKAPKFIKFALGENVKQSNWGDFNTVRFPQTRMGVEQVYMDAFSRAKRYMEETSKAKNGTYQVDLELEALAEILRKERFITCHSYIQSEINMLMKVADSFVFNVNTFTHILEGYKVADKMKAHGAGASTFADWWAYKFEVLDAIPYNAAMMQEQGLVVAINSDDAEMGRRLNQEAAKSVKYGGMSEMDAWKMVTLNPAKLLHLDDRMGSVKVGKDADLVLWTSNPLSINAIVKMVFIDGILFFDLESDRMKQTLNNQERARIIAKMLDSNESGTEKRVFEPVAPKFFHCDTMEQEGTCSHNTH